MPMGTVLLEGTGPAGAAVALVVVVLADTGHQEVPAEWDSVVGEVVVHAGTVVAGTRVSTLLAWWRNTGFLESLPQNSFGMTAPENATVLETVPGGTVAGSGLG